MKGKILISVLFVLVIFSAIYIYMLKNETNQQNLRVQQQLKTIDSLQSIVKHKESEERAARKMAEMIIAKTQKEIDSLQRSKGKKTN